MRFKIDLHGLTHDQAVKKVENDLIGISMSKFYEVKIITGKSQAMQDKIIKEVLDPYNFFYYIPHTNTGMIAVTENDLI